MINGLLNVQRDPQSHADVKHSRARALFVRHPFGHGPHETANPNGDRKLNELRQHDRTI
jgi:hypothetical protein